MGVREGKSADTHAQEKAHRCGQTNRCADIHAEGANVRPLSAVHIDENAPPLRIGVQELQTMNHNTARPHLHLCPLPCQVIGALTANLDR